MSSLGGGGHGHGRVDVEQQHGVEDGLDPGRAPEHVPGGAAQPPSPSDDGELPDGLGGVVAPGHHERAPVELPGGEQQRDADHEHRVGHGAQHVGALRAAEGLRVHGDAGGEQVVHGHRVAEEVARVHRRVLLRPRALHQAHGRLPRTAHDVVHVQPQPHRAAPGRHHDDGGGCGAQTQSDDEQQQEEALITRHYCSFAEFEEEQA